jgi:sporulation protein YlmC with PRC-barrel domain
MRTSDLIGVKVYDNAGREIGKVHDIRVARDGQHQVEAAYVATHLFVAAGSVGTRLGYGYGHMHGPWPLSAVMRRAMARSYAVTWDQVGTIEPDRELRLSVSRDELMTMAELVGGDES